MSDPSVVDGIINTGAGIASGGGLVAVMVRFVMGGVTKRLDTIDGHLKDLRKEQADQRKEANTRHEAMLERVVKVEGKAVSAHARLDALVTPVPRKRRAKRAPHKK